jgi:alkaline phosphatase
MKDAIYSSSNAAATTHAFGFKTERLGSFGKDGEGDAARTIDALSGYTGSLLRQAANGRHPVGVVNDGTVTEPGTGAFLAEVGNRNDHAGIALQMLTGRPGEEDRDPHVIMGGGEQWFLPAPTDEERAGDQTNGYHGWGARTDGRNLIEEAEDRGYTVVRTRAEFTELVLTLTSDRCERNPMRKGCAPKVLALFARQDTYNDTTEESLIRNGLRIPGVDPSRKETDLLLYGTYAGVNNPGVATDPDDENAQLPVGLLGANGQPIVSNGQNPPTFAEMVEAALLILHRRSARGGRDFMFVGEPESTDNFGNENNAIGTLVAMKRADDAISVAREYVRAHPRTLLLNAADGDASGMQIAGEPLPEGEPVPVAPIVNVNPTGDDAEDVEVPTDGRLGRGTEQFLTEPDQFGQRLPFHVLWVGPDVLGGVVTRAEGLNAGLLQRRAFSERFDNIDIYRVMHRTLFGVLPPYPEGQEAPTRE